MTRYVALIGMLLLEIPAVSVALSADGSNAGLLALAAAHMGISLVAAVLGWWMLPSHLRSPVPRAAAFLLALCLCVPVLGPALLAVIVAVTVYFRGEIPEHEITRLASHGGYLEEREPTPVSTVTGIRAKLSATDTASKTRVEALLKLRILEDFENTSAIRNALLDEAEEVRLIAFGILDIREKSVMRQIRAEQEHLTRATSTTTRTFHAKQLAWLYAELVDQGLAEGEVLRHALAQVERHAGAILAENPAEAGMWLLRGRVSARMGQVDAARDAFRRALDLGLPKSQGIPSLAELEFNERRFSEVRRLLMSAPGLKDLPDVESVVRFWSGRSAVPVSAMNQ